MIAHAPWQFKKYTYTDNNFMSYNDLVIFCLLAK